MSKTNWYLLSDFCTVDDMIGIINEAQNGASTESSTSFVQQIAHKFNKDRLTMKLTEAQMDWMTQLAGRPKLYIKKGRKPLHSDIGTISTLPIK